MRRLNLTSYSESMYDAQYYPLTDGVKKIRDFIMQELISEIKNRYRTTDR